MRQNPLGPEGATTTIANLPTSKNFEEYLEFIGLAGVKLEESLESLSLLIRHHIRAFHYQNSTLFSEGKKLPAEREIPSLEWNKIFHLMVTEKSGGYCFQNAELFFHVLRALNFKVKRLLSEALNKPTNEVRAVGEGLIFSHEVLIVEIDGKDLLVDTAYANNSLRAPLQIQEGVQKIDSEAYQIIDEGQFWRVDLKLENGWFSLHRSSKTPCSQEELNAAHNELFLMPNLVPIRDSFLKLGTADSGEKHKRKAIVWFSTGQGSFFKSYVPKGKAKTKELHKFEEVVDLASKKFNINLGGMI